MVLTPEQQDYIKTFTGAVGIDDPDAAFDQLVADLIEAGAPISHDGNGYNPITGQDVLRTINLAQSLGKLPEEHEAIVEQAPQIMGAMTQRWQDRQQTPVAPQDSSHEDGAAPPEEEPAAEEEPVPDEPPMREAPPEAVEVEESATPQVWTEESASQRIENILMKAVPGINAQMEEQTAEAGKEGGFFFGLLNMFGGGPEAVELPGDVDGTFDEMSQVSLAGTLGALVQQLGIEWDGAYDPALGAQIIHKSPNFEKQLRLFLGPYLDEDSKNKNIREIVERELITPLNLLYEKGKLGGHEIKRPGGGGFDLDNILAGLDKVDTSGMGALGGIVEAFKGIFAKLLKVIQPIIDAFSGMFGGGGGESASAPETGDDDTDAAPDAEQEPVPGSTGPIPGPSDPDVEEPDPNATDPRLLTERGLTSAHSDATAGNSNNGPDVSQTREPAAPGTTP